MPQAFQWQDQRKLTSFKGIRKFQKIKSLDLFLKTNPSISHCSVIMALDMLRKGMWNSENKTPTDRATGDKTVFFCKVAFWITLQVAP